MPLQLLQTQLPCSSSTSTFPAVLHMSTAGDQPKQLLALLLLCVHISHNFRTKNLNLAEAKDFFALEKVLLLLSRTCTTRSISLGMLPITPLEQTLSISNAKVDLSRIVTLVPIHPVALERCVTRRIFSVPIFKEKQNKKLEVAPGCFIFLLVFECIYRKTGLKPQNEILASTSLLPSPHFQQC